MPKPRRIATRDQIVGHEATTPDGIERAVAELVRLQVPARARSLVTVDLVIGDNRVIHRLGRVPQGANLTPSVASAAFGWAMGDPTDTTAVIEVVGTDQPAAIVEFY